MLIFADMNSSSPCVRTVQRILNNFYLRLALQSWLQQTVLHPVFNLISFESDLNPISLPTLPSWISYLDITEFTACLSSVVKVSSSLALFKLCLDKAQNTITQREKQKTRRLFSQLLPEEEQVISQRFQFIPTQFKAKL